MANYENLKVIKVFEKKTLEFDKFFDEVLAKKQVTFIDAFRPGLRVLLAVFRPVGRYQRIEIPKNGDFISVDYSVFPCIIKDGTPMFLYVVQHMKVTYETGEFVETGSDYLDGQNEAVISAIVEAQGKSWNEVKIVHEPHRTA